MDRRHVRGAATAALLFALVQAGALALVTPFDAADYQVVEDPSNPVNSGVYLAAVLVATALLLTAFRYDLDRLVRLGVVGATALLSWYVFSVVVPASVPGRSLVAAGLALGVGAALLLHPEWYVVDAAGVLIGAGAAGLFGISFGPLPAVVLLVALAVYDAVSVYGTEHMLDLADGVLDLRVPVVLVIPVTAGYSLLGDDDPASATGGTLDDPASADGGGTGVESATERGGGAKANGTDGAAETTAPGDRDVLFIGLGDAVMPTVIVASAAAFSSAPALGLPLLPVANLPALTAALGTFVGLGVLLAAVFRGEAHAGLPLLNGGAIGGYLLGSVLAGVPLAEAVGLAPYL